MFTILRFLFSSALMWGVGKVFGRMLPLFGRALRLIFR